jgi:uncharacterized protein (TIGR02270 family)
MNTGETLSLGLDEVITQHLFEASHLATVRTVLVGAPHAELFALRRHDERIAAHLDGLFVAADAADGLIDEALASPEPGHVFAAAVVAVRDRNGARLEQLYQLADGNAQMRDALIDAMGWVEPSALRGIVSHQLASTQPRRCEMAILASARHHVDPGLMSQRRLEASDAAVRSAASRAGAVLGYRELVSELARKLRHETDPACRLWMGWAAVLLGDREEALQALKLSAFEEDVFRWEAFALVCLADTVVAARESGCERCPAAVAMRRG